jgi:predicted O-methyltransferase YrrM
LRQTAGVHEVDLLFPSNISVLREASALDHAAAPPGLLEEREGACLYALGRRGARLGTIVEIGAFRGRSTWYLARALGDSGVAEQLVSIDPHLEGTQADFVANVERAGVAHLVDARSAYSQEVADDVQGPLGMLWIDGDHSYEGVSRDFDDWFPKLACGGWVAFHDTVDLWYGPTRLVRELLATRADLASIGVIGSITYARKTEPSRLNRLRAARARAAFNLVAALRRCRFGRGPLNFAAGEP